MMSRFGGVRDRQELESWTELMGLEGKGSRGVSKASLGFSSP